MIALSVVIPTYQRSRSVERALIALAAQTLPPGDYEVIVSIDGSQDGTREMAEALPVPYALQVLWQPNRGRAAACNAGIHQARGEIIVLLDDDMEPLPGFLAAHWNAHAMADNLGVMGTVPMHIDAHAAPVTRYIADKFNRHLENLARPDHTFRLRDFYSGNFSIRREVLLHAGLFDESFKMYGNEDLELFMRLAKHKVQIVFCPTAEARQSNTKDLTALVKDNLADGHTAILFAQKHPAMMFHTRLETYTHFSWRWRLVRAVLVRVSQMMPALPHWITLGVQWFEQRCQLPFIYALVLDYFFWLGVHQALNELPACAPVRQAMFAFEKQRRRQ